MYKCVVSILFWAKSVIVGQKPRRGIKGRETDGLRDKGPRAETLRGQMTKRRGTIGRKNQKSKLYRLKISI